MTDDAHPRDNLTRSVPFTLVRSTEPVEPGDGLTLEGYAAVFDTPTRIDSWEGQFDETIARGAFTKTIKERTPVVQFDHGSHPLVGSIPIAVIEDIHEDTQGLYVKARLMDNWLVDPVREAIANGSIDGMSFRFCVVKEKWDDSGDIPQRTVQELKCPELGPVVFPAYDTTSVGVRGLPSDPQARLELARALVLGTPDTEAAAGTSDSGAAPTEPADATRTQEPEAAAGTSATYQPAQRPTMTPERRESQRGYVKALLAQFDKEPA